MVTDEDMAYANSLLRTVTAGLHNPATQWMDHVRRVAAALASERAREREACALECETVHMEMPFQLHLAFACAARIRARKP